MIALFISIIALYYTIRAFILKSGHKFRCSTSISSSIDSEQKYVSSIVIENQKDKAAVIFKIYLRIGVSNYLEIEDFSDNPLIIKPFEVYYKKYEPIIFYSDGTNVTSLENVIGNHKINSKIILTTTKGKYKVKNHIHSWDAIIPYFNNHLTRLLSPVRLSYKDINYGSEIKFIVIFKFEDKTEQRIKLYRDNTLNQGFKNIRILDEHIASQDNLEKFFVEQRNLGNIKFESIEIFDFGVHVDNLREKYDGKTAPVESYSYFKYFILGKIYTIIDNIELWRSNRRTKRKNK